MITKSIKMKIQDLFELKVTGKLRNYHFTESGLLVKIMRNTVMDKYNNNVPQNLLYGYYVDIEKTGKTEDNLFVIVLNNVVKILFQEIEEAYEAQASDPTNKDVIVRLNKIVDYELEICVLLSDNGEDQQNFFMMCAVPTVNQKVKPCTNEKSTDC